MLMRQTAVADADADADADANANADVAPGGRRGLLGSRAATPNTQPG